MGKCKMNEDVNKTVTCCCCKEKTNKWGIYNMKYYCKKCKNYEKSYGEFPSKILIKELKEEGRW